MKREVATKIMIKKIIMKEDLTTDKTTIFKRGVIWTKITEVNILYINYLGGHY